MKEEEEDSEERNTITTNEVSKHFCIFLLLLEVTDYRVGCISWDNLGVVKHVEFLSGISSSVQENGLLASWVVGQEAGDIENLAVDNHPAVIFLVVLGNLVNGETTGTA